LRCSQARLRPDVATDELVFEEGGRGPDEELRLQFEAIARFSPEEKKTVREVLDSLILKHEAKRWGGSLNTTSY